MIMTRKLLSNELNGAMLLSDRVFSEFEAPEYSDEGIVNFRKFIYGESIQKKYNDNTLVIWGAYNDDTIVGIFALRDQGHITLVFVDKAYHRKGIATTLWKEALEYCINAGYSEVTVNSSPYGRGFYESVGFTAVSDEKTDDGIRYIPMKYIIERQ